MICNERKPNFHLTRGDMYDLLVALEEYGDRNQKAAQRSLNKQTYVPGEAASYAMAAASASELRKRLKQFAVDNGWIFDCTTEAAK
jgi:hypothetical protein